MYMAASFGQRCFLPKLAFQQFDHLSDHLRVNMRYFQIVNVPQDSTLLTVDDLVHHTGIIWVVSEPPLGEL